MNDQLKFRASVTSDFYHTKTLIKALKGTFSLLFLN